MYLLDTSVVSDIVNPNSPWHTAAMKAMPPNADQVQICTVTFGEMSFGREILYLRNPPPAQQRLDEADAFVAALEKFAKPLPITNHIAREYAQLRAAYASGLAPNRLSSWVKSKPVELWQQQVPPSMLKITENDLWIAAVAVTHDLILMTRDKDFDEVKKHYASLKLYRIQAYVLRPIDGQV